MRKTPLVDKALHYEHLGDLKMSDHIYSLVEVEQHIIDECTRRGVFWSYDVTADEPFPFHTINYATFAGMIMMTPLQPDLATIQIAAASRHCGPSEDFVNYLRARIADNTANKYDRDTVHISRGFEALVVLPGDNKIKTHVCLRRIKQLIKRHGNQLIIKPHPLTTSKILNKFRDLTGADKDHFVPIESDLYALMPRADVVYTTILSESALYAMVLGKRIEPIHPFNRTREPGSFRHVNQLLFNQPGALGLINRTFTSHKSGIVCPTLEINWKAKINAYLDYILEIREHTRDHYITT